MRNPEYSLFSPVLQINFGESDYSIGEGAGELSSQISLRFRINQNPFTVMLSPVTVATAEEMGLGVFFNFYTVDSTYRARAGIHTLFPHTPVDNIIAISLRFPWLIVLQQFGNNNRDGVCNCLFSIQIL